MISNFYVVEVGSGFGIVMLVLDYYDFVIVKVMLL